MRELLETAPENLEADTFRDLVVRHQSMVFSIAYAFLRNRATAEEVAQDVFLDLHRSLNKIESPAHVVHWLRRVTAHRSIDRQRRSRPLWALEDIGEPAAPQSTADPMLAEALRQLIASLPEQPRMVMILRYQEDMDPSEISAALDMPAGTVKSHIQRALKLLREKLLRKYGEVSI
jgi:RNA polymerase sigma-70 factor, ECF subfamily